MRVSLVIPVLNAEAFLPTLLERIEAQRPEPPDEIILVDSGSRDRTGALVRACPRVKLLPIARFTHGGARNLGARAATREIVVFMTQDALPMNTEWLARLVECFRDPAVAAVYSRQVPREDAKPMERFYLECNFPPGAPVRRQKQANRPLRHADVFFSNVSSVVRRDVLLLHPFDETLIMSEDQQLCRDLLTAGYTVVYQPASVVIHSHNYPLSTVFRRYFDSIYAITRIVSGHNVADTAGAGVRYSWREAGFIARKHPVYLPYYLAYLAAKTAGILAGHAARFLPRAWARQFSLHRYHWNQPD